MYAVGLAHTSPSAPGWDADSPITDHSRRLGDAGSGPTLARKVFRHNATPKNTAPYPPRFQSTPSRPPICRKTMTFSTIPHPLTLFTREILRSLQLFRRK